MEPENTTPLHNEAQSTEASDVQSTEASESQDNATKAAQDTETQSAETNQPKDDDTSTALKVGDIVTGTVSKHVHNLAFIALENGQEAYINMSDLRDETGKVNVVLGQKIEAKVSNLRSGIELTREHLIVKQAYDALEKAFNEKTTVEGTVTKTNKGGYEVRLGSISAFCPRSHFSLRPERAPQQQVGKVLEFTIEEFKRGKRGRIVVSRRSILEAIEAKKNERLAELFNVNDVIQGKVTQLSKFGVFVDVGEGIEGLIPMSELSHAHVNRASDVVKSNDTVEVKVINIDASRGRLSLSIKQLTPDPWLSFVENNKVGSETTGKIVRITNFGAFVQFAEGVEGLLHISAISATGRLNHPSERISEGEEIKVVIEEVVNHDRKDRRKIRLMTPEVAERRKPIDVKISVDDVITAPVKEVSDRGVTLEIASNLDGFIPASETGTAKGANLQDRFQSGKEVQAKVMMVDLRKAKVRLSIKALENHEEEMAYKQYQKEMRQDQSRMSSTFGDLLKNFQ